MYKSRKDRGADIVDVMMKIMADGESTPFFSITQNRRNAADQFNSEHQNELINEEHGDCIESVHSHNKSVPRLNDVLDKRKSIVTITTRKMDELSTNKFDPECIACAQNATFNELKKMELKPRCNQRVEKSRSSVRATHHSSARRRRRRSRKRRSRKRQPRDKNSNDKRTPRKLIGIDKSKTKVSRKPLNAFYKLSKTWAQKSCQCSYVNNQENQCTHCTSTNPLISNKTIAMRIERGGSVASFDEIQLDQSKDPSVSSYNSFWSSDHEPMDTNNM